MSDLKILETDGVDITYMSQKINLKGAVSYFPADNLASNGISGHVESFNSNNLGNFYYYLKNFKFKR